MLHPPHFTIHNKLQKYKLIHTVRIYTTLEFAFMAKDKVAFIKWINEQFYSLALSSFLTQTTYPPTNLLTRCLYQQWAY